MKNKIKLIVMALICSFLSCEDSEKENMNIHENSNNKAPYVRAIFESTLIKYATLSTSKIEATLSTPANNVISWKTSVRLVSGDNTSEYFPLNDYTVTTFPSKISIPISDIATALGIEISDILPADVLEFSSVSTGLDGKELRYTDLKGDLSGQAEQRQAYDFSIAISCAPVSSPVGEWTINMSDVYGDGWDGAYLTTEIDGVSTDYTVTAETATFSFTVPEGSSLTWSYTLGNYEEEHIFSITGPDGTVYGEFNGENGIPFCFF